MILVIDNTKSVSMPTCVRICAEMEDQEVQNNAKCADLKRLICKGEAKLKTKTAQYEKATLDFKCFRRQLRVSNAFFIPHNISASL